MTLVEHARQELGLIGEEPQTIDWYCRVIAEFASFGHSGGSASVCIPVLHELLQFKPLSPLTADPAEWIDQTEASGVPMWQNKRNSTAFSGDGGKTYWLLDEQDAAGSAEVTPLHHSEPARHEHNHPPGTDHPEGVNGCTACAREKEATLVTEPAVGDAVILKGRILKLDTGVALVEVYRSFPLGGTVAVQCGALELTEDPGGDEDISPAGGASQ